MTARYVVSAVTDCVNEGQKVKVKVLGFDDKGCVKSAMKALLEDKAAEVNTSDAR